MGIWLPSQASETTFAKDERERVLSRARENRLRCAILVPADATNSARQAMIIAGDGLRSLRFISTPFSLWICARRYALVRLSSGRVLRNYI